MAKADDPFGLIAFAGTFLSSRSITHHREVRTEDLADSFRQFFGLPVFAKLADLRALCARLGISVDTFEGESEDLEAINMWGDGTDPSLVTRSDLTIRRTETSFGHEIREIIEQSFCRADPNYVGLNTSDNRAMNPESDFFSSCLLMPAAESRALLAETGYDMVMFSARTGRSLASVIQRAQALFPQDSTVGPVAGCWLFEAPWRSGRRAAIRWEDIPMAHRAHLNGFSMAKGRSAASEIARLVFPQRGDKVSSFRLAWDALTQGKPRTELLGGFDLFLQRDFFVAAEPLFFRNGPPRVLQTAVRLDTLEVVQAWLERLDAADVLAQVSAS